MNVNNMATSRRNTRAGAGRQKIALNSSDRVWQQLRDASFAAVGPWLAAKAKAIQSDYQVGRPWRVRVM